MRGSPAMVASNKMCVPASSKSQLSPGVYWKYQFIVPVSGLYEIALLVKRLSPGRAIGSNSGTGLPVPQMVWFVSGS